jgi:DNA-binding transcriptional regulator YhcF (GntR family)
MGLLDSINHDFAKSIRKKNYSKELPVMLEETLEALTMLKTPFIMVKRNENGTYVTASGADSFNNAAQVYATAVSFIVMILKNSGYSDDKIRNTLTDIVDSSLATVHDEPDAPQKYFHLNKK